MTWLTERRHTERPQLNTGAHEELARTHLRHTRLTVASVAALAGALLTWLLPLGLPVRLLVVALLFVGGLLLPLSTRERAQRWALDWIGKHSGLAYESFLESVGAGGGAPSGETPDTHVLEAELEERAYLATRGIPRPSFTPYYLPLLAVTLLLLLLPQVNLGGILSPGSGNGGLTGGAPPPGESAPAAPAEPEQEPQANEARIPFEPDQATAEAPELPEENQELAEDSEESAAERFLQALREREAGSSGEVGEEAGAGETQAGDQEQTSGGTAGQESDAQATEPAQASDAVQEELRDEGSSASPSQSEADTAPSDTADGEMREGEPDGQGDANPPARPIVEREEGTGEGANQDAAAGGDEAQDAGGGEEGGDSEAAQQAQDEPGGQEGAQDDDRVAGQEGAAAAGDEGEAEEAQGAGSPTLEESPGGAPGEENREDSETTALQGNGPGDPASDPGAQEGQSPSQDDGMAGNDDESATGGAGAATSPPEAPDMTPEGDRDIAFLPGQRRPGESSSGGEVRVPGSEEGELPVGQQGEFHQEEIDRVVR